MGNVLKRKFWTLYFSIYPTITSKVTVNCQLGPVVHSVETGIEWTGNIARYFRCAPFAQTVKIFLSGFWAPLIWFPIYTNGQDFSFELRSCALRNTCLFPAGCPLYSMEMKIQNIKKFNFARSNLKIQYSQCTNDDEVLMSPVYSFFPTFCKKWILSLTIFCFKGGVLHLHTRSKFSFRGFGPR